MGSTNSGSGLIVSSSFSSSSSYDGSGAGNFGWTITGSTGLTAGGVGTSAGSSSAGSGY